MRRRYQYKSRFQREEDHLLYMSTKQIYESGLHMGHYLRRTLFHEKILKPLSSGNNVYFLARDMTPLWEYLRDQYKNLSPVYGIARNTDEKHWNQMIDIQINLKKKCTVVDTGFSGSMIDPIAKRSGYRKINNPNNPKTKEKLVKGLLITSHSEARYDYISTERQNENHRRVVVDLEHSPKHERNIRVFNDNGFWEGEYTTVTNLNAEELLAYRAFKLGLFAGFMNLGKVHFRKMAQKPILKKKIERRIQENRKINESIRTGLWFLNHPELYEIVPNKEGTFEVKKVTYIVENYDLKNRKVWHYGTLRVKRYWNNKNYALKACEVLCKHDKKRKEDSGFKKYIRLEKQVREILNKISTLEKEIHDLQEF